MIVEIIKHVFIGFFSINWIGEAGHMRVKKGRNIE